MNAVWAVDSQVQPGQNPVASQLGTWRFAMVKWGGDRHLSSQPHPCMLAPLSGCDRDEPHIARMLHK